MRKASRIFAMAALAGVALSVFRWGPSVAQFTGGGGSDVRVTNNVRLEGPSDVTITGQTGPVDSNITNTYVPIGMGATGPRLQSDVAGTVAVSGFTSVPTVALENGTQVSLTSASLATLTATTGKGNCTYVDGDPTATIGTAPANIPASPMANRTAIEIFNHSNAPANYLLCSAQGTATTTSGVRIEHGNQSRKWEGLGAGVLISCRCVTGTCEYNYQEEWCYQQ